MYKGKNVLVTGGTGVIGIPIVNKLVGRGANVTVVAMENPDFVMKYLPREVTYLKRNLLDIEQCKDVIKNKQIVINLAGTKRSVGIGYKGVSQFLVNMLRLQTNIMEISHDANVERFLFVGSICEYPKLEIRDEESVWNGKPEQNDWIPGIQKRVGEVQAEAYFLDTGWDAVRVVRPSNVYGPFDNFSIETGQVIPALIAKLVKNPDRLDVIGDGSNVRDFIFSEDVAHWSLEALEKAPVNFPVNLGSGSGLSIRELVSVLIEVSNKKIPVFYSSKSSSGDLYRVLDMSRARKLLGFNQLYSFESGLRMTYDWVLKNPNWQLQKYI